MSVVDSLNASRFRGALPLLIAALIVFGPAIHTTPRADSQTPPTACVLSQPLGIAFDPMNRDVYVTGYGSNTVSVISSVTNTIIRTIPVGANPNQVAYDPVNHEVYVSNSGSTTVSAISTLTNTVVATITVDPHPPSAGEYGPYWLAFDPSNNEMFVTNYNFPSFSNTVAAISSTNTVVATITVGVNPIRLAYNPTNHDMYVDDYSSGQVSVINATNTLITTLGAPGNPNTVGYDPANGNMYVSSNNSNDVTVINSTTNNVITTVSGINYNAYGMSYDPANTEMYVSATAFPGDAVYAINSTTNTLDPRTPIAADNPSSPGPYTITYSPSTGNMYASDSNGGDPGFVTVISSTSNTKIATIAVGSGPDQSVFNPANGDLYVANAHSDSVSVISPTNMVVATITSANCTLSPPGCQDDNGNSVQDQQAGNSNSNNDDKCQQQDQRQNQASSTIVANSMESTLMDVLKLLLAVRQ